MEGNEMLHADAMKAYWRDATVLAFEGRVCEVVQEPDRVGVVLEETYFYPQGGGQPSDRGSLAGWAVLDVQEQAGRIVHYLARNPQVEAFFTPGVRAAGEIERAYRIQNMRLHTACHLLFGAARRLFAQVHYAGFNIGEVGNLYLECPRQIRADDLREMARLANEVIVEDRPVRARFVTPEESQQIPGLAYNYDTIEGMVRIIEVEGWDTAACSGTHVGSTGGIGLVKVLAREVHKKNVTRIDYAVGARAVAEMANDERILLETAEKLSTGKEQLPQVVQKMAGELQAAQKELRKLRERLVDYRAAELEGEGEAIEGVTLIMEADETLDAAGVKGLASKVLASKGLAARTATVVGITGGSGGLCMAAACSPDLDLALAAGVVGLAKKWGGGGGGRPNFVTAGGMQGSSAPALAEELKDVLTEAIRGRGRA